MPKKGGDDMSDGTSVGKIQMDFEINQKSVDFEIKKVSNYINSNFKNMFSGIAKQSNNFIKNSLSRMNSGFKNFAETGSGSNDKVSKSISKMNEQYKKTEDQIKKIQNELLNMDAQRDAIINNYKDMPAFSGMTKDESLEQMLKSDSGFEELTEKIEELNSELDPLIVKNKLLGDELEKVGDSASKTGNNLNKMSESSKKAGNEAKKSFFKFKLFGDEMKNSGAKAAGFAAVINRSFMTILRRLFVYNLIMKGIRGVMSHMGAALNTNKQFVTSLNIVKTNLRVAFQPVYDYILPALNALMQGVAKVTTYIASAISSLFGKSYQQSFNAAKGLEASKKAMEGYGKSAKKASGALAGFDEINQLDISDDEDAGGGGTGEFEMTMPDTSTIDLSGMERLKSMLQPTIEAFERFKTGLEPLRNFAATGLQDFYNNFLVPVGNWTFGEGLPRFIDAITVGLLGVNWQVINDGLKQLWFALTPFAINVGEGLLWFWENVLTPLGTWTMNNIVPIFLDMLSEAIRILSGVIEPLKPLALWLWDNFLKPLAEWTGGIIISVLEGIRDALRGIGDWIADNQGIVQAMAIIVGSFAAAWGLVNAALGVWNIVGVIATGVINAFNAAILFLTSPVGIAVVVIGTLIAIGIALYKNWDEVSAGLKKIWEGIKKKAEEIWNAIKKFFSETWDSMKEKTSVTWNSIKENTSEIWNNIKSFLTEKIWNPIKTTASTIFNAIKGIVSTTFTAISTNIDKFSKSFRETWDNIWNGAKTIFSDVWDSLTGIVKSVINGIIGIVNKFIDFWNKIELKVPSVNIPLVGEVGGFSIGVPKLSNIPKLARGGIIDQPTLAMVGEAGKEAVVPLENNTEWMDKLASAIVSAMMAVMQFNNGNQSSGDSGDIIMNLDGRTIARIIKPYLDDEYKRIGTDITLNPI